MSIEVIRPDESIEQSGVGLVLFNHLGSTVPQDTGRDAQFMADRFGIPVITADRPGTHGFLPNTTLAHKMSDIDGYSEEIGKVGESINQHLEKLGIEKTIVVGRSAAGLGALALTAGQVIKSQRALFVAEPVGCESMSVDEAKRRVKKYGSYQKELQATDPDLIKPFSDNLPLGKRLSRLGHMVLDYKFDVFHNQYIWATDASIHYATTIAKDTPSIDTVIEFAEHSLTAKPDVYERLLGVASYRDEEQAPFTINQSLHTTHASYDNRDFMSTRLQPTIHRIDNVT